MNGSSGFQHGFGPKASSVSGSRLLPASHFLYIYANKYIGSHLVVSVFLLQEGGDGQKGNVMAAYRKNLIFFGFKSCVPANLRNIPPPTGRVRFCLGIMSSIHIYFGSRRKY